jgi:F-box protein 11
VESNQQLPPIAFLSYTRFDDNYYDSKISRYATRLASDVRLHTGLPFSIFVDKNDIKWGENWRARIKEGLDAAAFLLVFMTPSYFKSHECLNEYKLFLEREKELQRKDLILPIQYVECEELKNPTLCIDINWAQDLSGRQYRDWAGRDFKKEREYSGAYREEIEIQAKAIKAALNKPQVVRVSEIIAHSASEPTGAPEEIPLDLLEKPIQSDECGKPGPLPWHARKNPRPQNVLIVDTQDTSMYQTVMSAIAHANPGDEIIIRPGVYRERLWITKRLSIVGDGDDEDVVIENTESVIECGAPYVELYNLKIKGIIEEGVHHGSEPEAIIVYSGTLDLKRCIIEGGVGGLAAQPSTNIQLADCWIHDCLGDGIHLSSSSSFNANGCWIESCRGNGITLFQTFNAKIKNCLVHDNHGWGIDSNTPVNLESNQLEFNTRGDLSNPTSVPNTDQDSDLPF